MLTSFTIRSPGDYQTAIKRLKTADRYDRAVLLEAMLHYDCVTHDNHPPCEITTPDAQAESAPADQTSGIPLNDNRGQFSASR